MVDFIGRHHDIETFGQLDDFITGMVELIGKPTVLQIDEEILPGRQEKEWLVSDVDAAFEGLVKENYTTTNFDEMVKNLENNKELYDLVFKIIMDGERKSFNIGNPVINLGAALGILAGSMDGMVIHNRVYEQRISDYMCSKIETSTSMGGYNTIRAREDLLY